MVTTDESTRPAPPPARRLDCIAGLAPSARKAVPGIAAVLAAVLAALPPAAGVLAAEDLAPTAFTATYGRWTVRCAQAAGDGDGESVRRCAMEQRFLWRDDQSGQDRLLLTVTLAAAKDGGMEATVLTPFGLLMEPGLRLRADSGRETVLPFRTCLPAGCVARGTLDPKAVRGFRAGAVLHVEADPAGGGDPFRLEGSLDGFSAASARLRDEVFE